MSKTKSHARWGLSRNRRPSLAGGFVHFTRGLVTESVVRHVCFWGKQPEKKERKAIDGEHGRSPGAARYGKQVPEMTSGFEDLHQMDLQIR
jgi:hypothetical protein